MTKPQAAEPSLSGRRRRSRAVAVVVLLLLVALRSGTAAAHALSPALLVLHEGRPGIFEVTWKIPSLRVVGADIRPMLPPECTVTAQEPPADDADSVTTRWTIDCGVAGLVGKRVGVDGLGVAKTDALVRLELADGRNIDTVLRAREPSITVPTREQGSTLASRYVLLGVEHILTGYDHLLFVFGLLLLARNTRALIATVSAFTLGHSITLTLAVLNLARVPPAPVEALIAFSIFVLAVELGRPPQKPTLMRRRPWLMALVFGLLHGLGFAGTLRAAGLPASAVPLALLGFNVGIELGQLAFVLAVVGSTALARPLTGRLPLWTRSVPVYAMGSLAAFWMIGRSLLLVR